MEGKLVSDLHRSLLVDIGNSQIKYALLANSQTELEIETCLNIDGLDKAIRSCNKLVLSSVAHLQQVTEIEAMCEAHGKPLQIISTEAQTFGVRCAYKRYQSLGVDRWLAILAGRSITQLPLAVIHLGTANTCDFILENDHLGGWISPGFSVMRESLIANTQQVFGNSDYPTSLELGDSTEQCVNMGCVAAVQGYARMAEEQLALLGDDYRVIIAGGARDLLRDLDHKHILFRENLVLQGLALYL
ncbi:MAG: type III pantothenate kinase [Paraglaciecola sp.]|jgi:type III pantothenate kinase